MLFNTDFGNIQNLQFGGALVKDELKPSKEGVLVYLNGGKDLSFILKRVEQAGGKVLLEKTQISTEIGFMSKFEDTEGNVLALHLKSKGGTVASDIPFVVFYFQK